MTFATTSAAMKAESFCIEKGLPGRLIPVPSVITAGCGLAWKAPVEAEEQIRNAFASAGMTYSQVCVIEV